MDKALATQLANIEKRTGKSLDALAKIVKASGLSKHGEIRDMLKRDLGMGHGDANTLVHHRPEVRWDVSRRSRGKERGQRFRRNLLGREGPAPADPRQADSRDRRVRPLRGRAKKGIR